MILIVDFVIGSEHHPAQVRPISEDTVICEIGRWRLFELNVDDIEIQREFVILVEYFTINIETGISPELSVEY